MENDPMPRPSLLVVRSRIWSLNRFYRLYFLPRELIGVGADNAAGASRYEELQAKPIERLRDDTKDNFVLKINEIEFTRLSKPSFWSRLTYMSIKPAAILRFRLVEGLQMSLALCNYYDVRTAITSLSAALASSLTIEMEIPVSETSFEYSGKTVFTYNRSHGNQIEFLDLDQSCYLWYPGNRGVVPGEWRIEGNIIWFRYRRNTLNPVTGLLGGGWEPSPIKYWSANIVHAESGDVFGLATGSIPYKLFAHPEFRSVP
jgi:hypothetical protein